MRGFNLLPQSARLTGRTLVAWALVAGFLAWALGELVLQPIRESVSATAAARQQLASQVQQAEERLRQLEAPKARADTNSDRAQAQGLVKALLALVPPAGQLEQLRLDERHLTVRGRMAATDLAAWAAASTPLGAPTAELMELAETAAGAEPAGLRFALRWRLAEVATQRP